MFKKLRNFALAFSGVVLVGLAPALMGPTGGYPSQPNFQAVNVQNGPSCCNTSTGRVPLLISNSGIPGYVLNATAAAANQRKWDTFVNGTSLISRVTNDANGAASQWLQIDRAAAVSGLSFGNATDNPTYSFLGTGALTLGGAVIISTPAAQLLVLNSTAANGPYTRWQTSGALIADMGRGAQLGGGFTAGAFGISAAASNGFEVGVNGSTTPSFRVTSAAAIQGPSSVDMTPESGTFVVTFENACTTSPTVTFAYYRIGRIVGITPTTNSGFTCTGDSTSMATSGTPVPASLRPAHHAFSPIMDGAWTDNGTDAGVEYKVLTTGGFSIAKCGAAANNCNEAGWTASGTRNFLAGTNQFTFTYTLD